MGEPDPLPRPGLPGIYAALVHNSPDLIAVVDRRYVYRIVNQAYSYRYGKVPGEIVGSTMAELLGDDVFHGSVMQPIDLCFTGEPATYQGWVTYPVHGRRFMEARYFPLHTGDRIEHVAALIRDVTDQNRAEERLKESEERHRTLIEFTSDWEYLLGPDGRFNYVSPSCEQLTGYRPEQFLENPDLVEKIAHPDDRAMVAQHHHVAGPPDIGEDRHLEFRIVTREGEVRWMSHRCRPVYGPTGAWLGWRASTRDVTDHKRAEEALRVIGERYQALFNAMSEGFVLFQAILDDRGKPYDLRYLDANAAAETLLGIRREEMFSRTILEAYPGAEPYWIEALGRVAITGEPALIEGFNRVYSKWWRAAAFSTGEGQVAAVFEDISAKREAEEALRESEERFRRVFEEGPIGMSIVGLDQGVLRANNTLCRMLGYTEQELAALTVAAVTHPDDVDKDVELAQQLFDDRIPRYQIDKRLITRGGAIIWVRLSVSALRDEAGKPLYALGMIEDITRQREADQLREQYVSFISHDLVTPLSVVIGQASTVRDRLAGKGLEPQVERLESILKSAWRMNSMLRDLLETSRLESGQWKMRTTPVDLGQLVAMICEQVLSEEARARLRFDQLEGVPSVEVDRERIERVVTNLITNALKYSDDGAPVVVRVAPGEGSALVSVTDRGAGIPLEEQPLVFQRFYRAVAQKKAEGIGLGLYITRLIVEAHGGRIWVESKQGEGSTFTFSLPASGQPSSPVPG
jgi:PAS domain S-box-containing protein